MLISERFRLRRLEKNDLPRCVAWLDDSEVREGRALWHPMGLLRDERPR